MKIFERIYKTDRPALHENIIEIFLISPKHALPAGQGRFPVTFSQTIRFWNSSIVMSCPWGAGAALAVGRLSSALPPAPPQDSLGKGMLTSNLLSLLDIAAPLGCCTDDDAPLFGRVTCLLPVAAASCSLDLADEATSI